MATELATKPRSLSQVLRMEGFSRRFKGGNACPDGMCQPVWELTEKLRDALRVKPGDVHLNGGSKIALKINEKAALVIEARSGLTSATLITGRQTHVSALDGVALEFLGEFGLKEAEVLRATINRRPVVAVSVNDEDMLVVQLLSSTS